MSIIVRMMLGAIGILCNSAVVSAQAITLSGLQGEWRVYKSELADPAGVQAYGDEQLRAIVGNKLAVGPDGIRWIISHGQATLREHTTFTESCSAPEMRDMGYGHFQIRCTGDVFVPGLTMTRDGVLVVLWWDGVDLYLRKLK